jgi:polyisoprenoid-binding protein YceI
MPAHRLFLLSFVLAVSGVLVRASEERKPAAGTYQVDTSASKVFVKVGSATRLGHPHGVEGKLKSGKVTPGGEGSLVFDMASFTADTEEARKRTGLAKKKVSRNEAKKVTDAMRGPDVLDVKRHPTATFRITSMTPQDRQAAGQPGTYHFQGRFTLHGKEQPLKFTAKLERVGKSRLKLTGSFTIRQSDHGITPYSALGGLAKVADELEISGDLVLTHSGDR